MGTPDFSVGVLKALHEAGEEIVLCVTQPDRVKGRGKGVSMTPVKEYALEIGVEVFQPEKIRSEEAVLKLKEYNADIAVVAAFGQILSKEILDMPRYGSINVHASLLPYYRGAAPIQRCIINGDEKTGVTIMQMDEGLDTGDMIMKKEVVIDKDETGGSLFDKLMATGAELCIEAIRAIENGTATRTPQPEGDFGYAKMLKKSEGLIDFSKGAVETERLVRALNPWPSAYTYLNGKMLKIWKAEVLEAKTAEPGEVSGVDSESFTVSCGEGSLRLLEIQIEGKRRMSVHDFLLGQKVETGMKLGG